MNRTTVSAKCPRSVEGQADTKFRKTLFLLFLCVLTLILSPALHGQATGSFSGNVLDKSGSAIPGATVVATSQGTGLARDTKTDSTGHYLIPLLPDATYTVRVDVTGFQSAESKDLHLKVDEAREIDFSLVPATVVTTVAVSGDAVAVETANPSLGQVITSQQVTQLPLNGRDFVQLATLTAGATSETNPNSFFTQGSDSEVAARGSFSLSVGGSRPNSTDWLLDGVDNNELTAGGIGVFSSIDDIQEFKVLTYTYSAEFGTRAGPTVLVTTKSGSNDWHGSLFEFVRNTDLDAKGDFDTTTPKFNLNQFGGSVGGPIRHNKTFFFVDGEQKYQREGITFTGLVPSLAMRSGDFSSDPFGNAAGLAIANPNMVGAADAYFQCDSSGNPIPAAADGSQPKGTDCAKIPSNLIDKVGQGMINIYPAPNVNAGSTTASYNFVNEPVRVLNETKFDARLDETLTAADNLFARFSYDQAFSFVPGGAPGLAESNAFGSNENLINHGRNIGVGWSHVFSPRTLNQASVGYDRIFDYIDSLGNFTCESAILGIPNADLGCSSTGTPISGGSYSQGLVSAQVQGGYWSLGDRGYSPYQGGTNIYSFKDDLDLIHGKHEIHTGLDFRGNQMNVGTEEFQDGFWLVGTFGNFTGAGVAPGNPEADLLMGIVGGAIHDQTYGGPITGRRWKIYRPFVEDDWRVLPSLTLNLGLAWDMTTPITEVHNRMADYIPSTTGSPAQRLSRPATAGTGRHQRLLLQLRLRGIRLPSTRPPPARPPGPAPGQPDVQDARRVPLYPGQPPRRHRRHRCSRPAHPRRSRHLQPHRHGPRAPRRPASRRLVDRPRRRPRHVVFHRPRRLPQTRRTVPAPPAPGLTQERSPTRAHTTADGAVPELTPKSRRLISPIAENPARLPPPGSAANPLTSNFETGRVTARMVSSPSMRSPRRGGGCRWTGRSWPGTCRRRRSCPTAGRCPGSGCRY